MNSQLLAKAIDIENWADKIDARHILPQLIRKLILATNNNITKIEFRSGEGTQFSGWDGIVNSTEANAFVPEGISGWELGVDKEVKKKIDGIKGDYKKRTDEPNGLTQKETTFIFVTPRRWASKTTCASEKCKEEKWKDVRVYDADDLETWLEQAPAVHYWFSQLIGKMPTGDVEDLESFWQKWSTATRPPITPKLLIASRQRQDTANKIRQWLNSNPSHKIIKSQRDTFDEMIAIFYAALAQFSEQEKDTFVSRCLIVRDKNSWNHLAKSTIPLILIPVFSERDSVLHAISQGHHVLIPVDRCDISSDTLEVPPLDSTDARNALIEMGVSQSIVDRRAFLARRSLSLLRYKLAIEPAILKPKWAVQETNHSILLATVLVGGWYDQNPNDQAILSDLGNRPYAEIREYLTSWVQQPDTFIWLKNDHSQEYWVVVSKEDALLYVAKYLTQAELDKLWSIFMLIFSDYQYSYSHWLKQRLVETLAILVTIKQQFSIFGNLQIEQWVTNLVDWLFSQVKFKRQWSLLSPHLQPLAEAAPNQFLRAIDDLLSDDNLATSLHRDSDLIIALEVLAWSPDYLKRSTLLLARMAALEPGNRNANAPLDRLKKIFIHWFPSTSASLKQRFNAIDQLRKQTPDVSWNLMIELTTENSTSYTTLPRWQENLAPGAKEKKITYEEAFKVVSGIFQRLIKDAGTTGSRWCALIDVVTYMPKSEFEAMIEKLAGIDLSSNDCFQIWEKLRALTTRHQNHQGKEWALPCERIDSLKQVNSRFEPQDIILKNRWLFMEREPELLGIMSYRKVEEISQIDSEPDKIHIIYQKKLAEVRNHVIEDIYRQRGIDSIFQLAKQEGVSPQLIGNSMAESELLRQEEITILNHRSSENDSLSHLANQFFIRRTQLDQTWGDSLRAKPIWQTWTPLQRAEYFWYLPFSESAWQDLSQEEETTKQIYWKHVTDHHLYHFPNKYSEAILQQLLEHKQFGKAIEFIDLKLLHIDQTELSPKIVLEVAKQFSENYPNVGYNYGTELRWELHNVLNFLAKAASSGTIDSEQVIMIQWSCFHQLKIGYYSEYISMFLYEQLLTSPKLFIEILLECFQHPKEDRVTLLLKNWTQLPRNQWIKQTQQLAQKHSEEFQKFCDEQIGKILSHSPKGSDGQFPHESVRELLEDSETSESLKNGFYIQCIHFDGLIQNGQMERLAKRYNNYANALNDEYPETAALLKGIASNYTRFAESITNHDKRLIDKIEDGI
jgi:hypothetical protein